MRKSFKFRLYPNERQRELLVHLLRDCQQLYNAALEQKRDAWRTRKQSLSCYSQHRQLPELRELPEYAAINAQVLQNVIRRVDRAYLAFFRRLKTKGEKPGFPGSKQSTDTTALPIPKRTMAPSGSATRKSVSPRLALSVSGNIGKLKAESKQRPSNVKENTGISRFLVTKFL